eukprot:4716901-Prymnesium_polylepis.1
MRAPPLGQSHVPPGTVRVTCSRVCKGHVPTGTVKATCLRVRSGPRSRGAHLAQAARHGRVGQRIKLESARDGHARREAREADFDELLRVERAVPVLSLIHI